MPDDIALWVGFNLLIFALLGLDLFFHRGQREISIKQAALWTLFWIALALAFNVFIYFLKGEEAALAFLTGYLLEKSLSIDNLFVFLLIFSYFRTPTNLLHGVLFWGVLGAIVFRALFIFLGIALITLFHWILYLFGAFLIFTGIRFAFQKNIEIHPEHNFVLKLFRKYFPVAKNYEGHRFFTKVNHRLVATPLLIVLVAIETTDILFAFDSIPLILGVTLDPFIVYTSNIFAILGLRSLFFVLARIMKIFHYLHYGLAFLLVFIGAKMLLNEFVPIPIPVTLGIVLFVLGLSVIFSVVFPDKRSDK